MLEVTDARTGQTGPLTGGRTGLLTVRAVLGCADGVAGPADLRALVVADVLRRVAEAGRWQVAYGVDRPELAPRAAKELARFGAALGVPAPDGDRPDGAAPDVCVAAAGAPLPRTGAVLVTGEVRGAPAVGPADAMALRLALLERPYAAPVELGRARLSDAARRLAGWRASVARWAREPSKPPPGEIRAAALTALARNLDTPKVLDLLAHVADVPGFAAGGRFEAFADLDRYLALELARDVGTV
jgi:hypothetical protein